MTVPTKISNQRFIDQLGLWGFKHTRTKGERWVMECRLGRLDVMAPHIHRPNRGPIIHAAYNLACAGDGEAFWARKAPSTVGRRDAVYDTLFTQNTYDWTAVAAEAEAARQARDAAAIQKIEALFTHVDTVLTEPQEQTVSKQARHRGAAAAVLQYFTEHPHESANAALIASRVRGYDTRAVGGALVHLHNLGHVERLVRGTYRLSATLAADKTMRMEHTGGVEVPKAALTRTPQRSLAASERVSVSTPVDTGVTAPLVTDHGDDLDALLELILPEGYRFKPNHLRAMRKWQAATADLLNVLRS